MKRFFGVLLVLGGLLCGLAIAQSDDASTTTKIVPILYMLLGDDSKIATEPLGQCNDGIDNDGDGLVDWQYDLGCSNASDTTEAALSRELEGGWTTFNLSADSRVVYVSSSDGDDNNDGPRLSTS